MERLSVLSWNILAPVFVRPKPDDPTDFAFFACSSEEDLAWEKRRVAIADHLRSVASDVVLLQEVELEKNGNGSFDLPRWLQDCGYDSWRIPEFAESEWEHQFQRNLRVLNRGAVTGVAILWKSQTLRLLNCATTSRTLGVTLSRGEVVFAIANVHLEGHPDLSDMRSKQLHSAVKKARQTPEAHLIVAGDFNSEPDEVRSHNEAHKLKMLVAGPTWSDGKRSVQIDHFLTDPTIEVTAVREFFSEFDAANGMPNCRSPSDHSPLGIECVARQKAAPVTAKEAAAIVSEERKRHIEALWNAIEKPEKTKGKPTPEQMEVLKVFAGAKKAFLAQFEGGELELAKKLSK